MNEMTTATELRQITQRRNELRADHDVEILDLIDIITKAYLCGDDIGREVANNRRNRIAARLQDNIS